MKLEIVGLSFSYGPNIIFDNLNVEFENGRLNAILGPNGVGKTTLLKLIAGIIKPHNGSILYNKQPLPKGSVAYVPQDNILLPWLTLYSNVELPLKIAGVDDDTRRLRVLKALEATEVLHLSNRYPKHISGGERKRVAIARALASNAPILLLDEPMANVDPSGREVIWRILRGLSNEKLVIVVTHEISEALMVGDLIYVMAGRPANIVEVLEGGEEAWARLKRIITLYYRQ
ncbi:MAG: ATP-binding cassette domain-containing protein [Nitrososphaerota archaeon]